MFEGRGGRRWLLSWRVGRGGWVVDIRGVLCGRGVAAGALALFSGWSEWGLWWLLGCLRVRLAAAAAVVVVVAARAVVASCAVGGGEGGTCVMW